MGVSDIMTVIQTVSLVVGVLVALGTLRGRGDSKAAELAEIKTNVLHIRKKLDRMDDLPERVVAVENSANSAHKRLDEHLRNHPYSREGRS